MKITVDLPESATPGRYGVYVLFDGVGEVLYIGRTMNLKARLNGHRSQSPFFKQVRSIEFTPCDGIAEARALEKSMIAQFHPAANVNDSREIRSLASRMHLPDWTVAKLTTLFEEGKDRGIKREDDATLNNYIKALRDAGWTLQSIGEGVGMTREGVRQREAFATQADGSRGVPEVPRRQPTPKVVKPVVPDHVLREMRQLFVQAKTVRGWTPADAPERAASVRLSELMAEQYLFGVSMYRISVQLGVTPLAVRARLARHGYTENLEYMPQVPYGTPMPTRVKDKCAAGHPMTGDNLRIVATSGLRVCRACERRRCDEYRSRKVAAS